MSGYSSIDMSNGGASKFIDLTDTPFHYTGQALKFARVNAAETGVEFVSGSGGVNDFVGLSDTPAGYVGFANKFVKVNASENKLEFVDCAGGASDFVGLSDTPADYAGAGGKVVRVKAALSGLEYADLSPADVGADPAGSAAIVQAALDAHEALANIHFADAPSDTKQYARQGASWTEIATGVAQEGIQKVGRYTHVGGPFAVSGLAPKQVLTYDMGVTDVIVLDPTKSYFIRGAFHIDLNATAPHVSDEYEFYVQSSQGVSGAVPHIIISPTVTTYGDVARAAQIDIQFASILIASAASPNLDLALFGRALVAGNIGNVVKSSCILELWWFKR